MVVSDRTLDRKGRHWPYHWKSSRLLLSPSIDGERLVLIDMFFSTDILSLYPILYIRMCTLYSISTSLNEFVSWLLNYDHYFESPSCYSVPVFATWRKQGHEIWWEIGTRRQWKLRNMRADARRNTHCGKLRSDYRRHNWWVYERQVRYKWDHPQAGY